ncbi:MAG: Signal peptidase I T [Syntrophorhabdus sp. PtaU1.Bin058]|nr:MAG: Signal peptidase I T [Syntrophorhabdus sp. PtaU1.Bin058]
MNKKHKKGEAPAADSKPVEPQKTKSKTREYIESLIIAAIIAFFVRSFFIQAFKIPSSSMEPTLLIGDHLLVNRLSYVVKVPFTDIVIFELDKPVQGDVVVFRFPVDRSKDFIKRVIAREGDTVEIKDKTIYVNGKKMKDPWGYYSQAPVIPGDLAPRDNLPSIKVPKDSYFVMGDNRDNSLDSRFWGFVKKEDLVGKAFILYFSWNSHPDNPLYYIRWPRIGRVIR